MRVRSSARNKATASLLMRAGRRAHVGRFGRRTAMRPDERAPTWVERGRDHSGGARVEWARGWDLPAGGYVEIRRDSERTRADLERRATWVERAGMKPEAPT